MTSSFFSNLLKLHPQLRSDFSLRGHETILKSPMDYTLLNLAPGQVRYDQIQECFYELLRLCDGQRNLKDVIDTFDPPSRPFVQEAVLSNEFQSVINWHAQKKDAGFLPCQVPEKSEQLVALTGVLLHVTNACNFRCEHCYHNDYHSPNDLTLKEIELLATEFVKNNVVRVVLSGGEPFLRADLPEIIDIFTQHRLIFNINTNGYFITDKYIDLLKKSSLRQLSISLDGPNNETHNAIRKNPNSFEKIMNTLPKLHEANIGIRLTATLGKHWLNNLHALDDLIDYLNQFNINNWSCNFSSQTGEAYRSEYNDQFRMPPRDQVDLAKKILSRFQEKNPENIKRASIAQSFRWQPGSKENELLPIYSSEYILDNENAILCNMHKHLIMMEPDGTVPFCSLFKSRYPIEMGSIREQPLSELWEKLCKIRMNYTIDKRRYCGSCNLLKYCGGGCPGEDPDPNADIFTTCDKHAKEMLPYLINDYEEFIRMVKLEHKESATA